MSAVKIGCPVMPGIMDRSRALLIGRRGQSNQNAFENTTALQPDYTGHNGNVFIWNGTTFVNLNTLNNTYPNPPAGKFAAEFSFAYHLAEATCRPVLLIKHAIGSTSMTSDWQVGQTIYEASCDTYDAAMAWLMANNVDYDFYDMWNQGENDSGLLVNANAYQARYETQLADTIFRFNPLGYICTLTRTSLGGSYIYSPAVQAGQIAAINSFADPTMIYINCDDLNPGQLHYDAAGYLEVGIRECNALLTLL